MPADIPPDTKDWTWVLRRPCPECGYDAAAVDPTGLAHELRANARTWLTVLGHPDAVLRPAPQVWSPLEYACHVRDVHRIFHDRLTAMLAEDEPHFANWDQDETAVTERYAEQDPAEVGPALIEAAYAVADLYASVPDGARERSGVRSDGSVFTIDTLGRYHLHDVVHHVHDVSYLTGSRRDPE